MTCSHPGCQAQVLRHLLCQHHRPVIQQRRVRTEEQRREIRAKERRKRFMRGLAIPSHWVLT